MQPAVFLIALLSTVGLGAFTIIKVARLITTRRQSVDVTERVEELERTVQDLQQGLAETQERLDFAERLLTAVRDQPRLGK